MFNWPYMLRSWIFLSDAKNIGKGVIGDIVKNFLIIQKHMLHMHFTPI